MSTSDKKLDPKMVAAFDAQMRDPVASSALTELIAFSQRMERLVGETAPFFVCVSFRSPFRDKSEALTRTRCKARELPDLLTAQATEVGRMMEAEGLGITAYLPSNPNGRSSAQALKELDHWTTHVLPASYKADQAMSDRLASAIKEMQQAIHAELEA